MDKNTVKITSSGWESQNKKPKVYITTDENNFNIDKSEASDLEIEIYKLKNDDKKSGMKKSILIGIIVGCVAVVIIIIVIIIVVVVKKRRRVRGA